MDIIHENFDWETYIIVNKDLKFNNIVDKKTAWEHWINHGLREDRPTSLFNNSNIHNGRLGNLFFVNMVLHFVALKLNLKCKYKYYEQFKKLGVYLHVGDNEYPNGSIISLTDENFLNIIQEKTLKENNISINNESWFQSYTFVHFLQVYFCIPHNRTSIINNNIFKKRYNNNNDLFVHIRLGDLKDKINAFSNIKKYYENILNKTNFITGYISSDSIQHELCQYFIHKYGLIVIDKCEVETIMFASTCKYITLSGGTFSWLIGFFAFFSTHIYYPSLKNPWYGDIFVFPNWISVNV